MISAEQMKYVEAKLTALGLSGLLDPLLTMRGLRLAGEYELSYPYDVGGQGILFVARPIGATECRLLVKMPMLSYHRPPAYISPTQITAARRCIEREGVLLERFSGTVLPAYHDLVHAPNPLLSPDWGSDITENEVYLVMEFIEGRGLGRTIGELHDTAGDYRSLERLALMVAEAVLALCETLYQNGCGFLYADIRPSNIVLSSRQQGVRIIDAGSIVPAQPDWGCGIDIPFSESYVPIDVYDASQRGEIKWPDCRWVVGTLGRTLYQVVTNRIPFPGEELDFSIDPLPRYSRLMTDYLRLLTSGQQTNFGMLHQITRQWLHSRLSD